MQSDCRSTHSAKLESAPTGVPEVTAVSAGAPGVGTEDNMLLSGSAAGALKGLNVPGEDSIGSGDVGALLTPSGSIDGAEVASVDPRLLIAGGLVPLPGEFGLSEAVTDGERAVSGACGSTLEAPGSGGEGGTGNAVPSARLNVSFMLLSILGLDCRLVAAGATGEDVLVSVEPGMLHLLQVICI